MKHLIVIIVLSLSVFGLNLQAQNFKTFTYRGQGAFSISYPANWEIGDNLNEMIKVSFLAPIMNDNFRNNVNVISSKKTSSLEEIFQTEQNVIRNNKQIFNDYKLVGKENVTINGINGLKITANWGISGIKIVGIQYILKKADNTTYTITFTIAQSTYERDKKIIDIMIQSFKSQTENEYEFGVAIVVILMIVIVIVYFIFYNIEIAKKEKELSKSNEDNRDLTKQGINNNPIETPIEIENSVSRFFNEEMNKIKNDFMKDIKREYEEAISDTINSTRGFDNSTVRLSLQTAIKCTSKALKISDFKDTGMNKQETDKIIEEVAEVLLDKYVNK